MAYTTPRTWVTGEVVTAAQLNANVRDNVAALYPIIFDLTLGAAQATVDSNTILGGNLPTGWRSMRYIIQARGDTAATNTELRLRFNNDATAVYDFQRTFSSGTTVSAAEGLAQNHIQAGNISAGSAPAGVFSQTVIDIVNHAGTTAQKTCTLQTARKDGTTTGLLTVYNTAGFWRNTAAITRVQLLTSAGNFDVGSRFTLYGLI